MYPTNAHHPAKPFELAIIGAGPAGMMAAIAAATHGLAGQKIVLIEKNARPGAKLLLTGKGRCNLCHRASVDELVTAYHGQGKFLYPAFYALSSDGLQTWFKACGLALKLEKASGRIYPASNKANDVLKVLEEEIKKLGIHRHYRDEVLTLKQGTDSAFQLDCKSGQGLTCKKVILTTGGLSYPQTGSDGFAFRLAKELEIKLTPLVPGLTGLILDQTRLDLPGLAGLSLADVQLDLLAMRPGKSPRKLGQSRGGLLFTHRGLSGPAVLDLSRQVARNRGQDLALKLNVLVARENDLRQELLDNPAKTPHQVLKNYLPKSLLAQFISAECLDDKSLQDLAKPVTQIGPSGIDQLLARLTQLQFPIKDVHGFGQAMVTSGGISLSEVNPKTLELKKIPGLYVAGESLDLDGPCGGFNLQMAFSTGYLAGMRAALSYPFNLQ